MTADGRVATLVFDDTAEDLMAEARSLVAALGVNLGAGCTETDPDCAARALFGPMGHVVTRRREDMGVALLNAYLRIEKDYVLPMRDGFVAASLAA